MPVEQTIIAAHRRCCTAPKSGGKAPVWVIHIIFGQVTDVRFSPLAASAARKPAAPAPTIKRGTCASNFSLSTVQATDIETIHGVRATSGRRRYLPRGGPIMFPPS
jgi:hypothetical protein